ncbi:MAG: hypothetical protein PHY43_10870 [Verrucomicrobiales bacterium]|nr:hypothetical protein [Verrucomicrobiales bacterium]
MKPKTFMLIAGALAAELRTAVAHSASYGNQCHRISQAPAGAMEIHHSITRFVRPVRGLNHFGTRSHGCHRGLLSRATPWQNNDNLFFTFFCVSAPLRLCVEIIP